MAEQKNRSGAKKPAESATFKISNGETTVRFTVNGSTVAALDEAFGWLAPERREKALARMTATHKRLLAIDPAKVAA